MNNYSVLPHDVDKTISMFASSCRYVEFVRILRILGLCYRKKCFSDITYLSIRRYKSNDRFYIEAYFYDKYSRYHIIDGIVQMNF